MGFPVEYVASYATPGSGNDYRWSRRLRARLRAAIAEADPDVIVFDGTHPYEALLGALRPQTAPRSGAGGRCGSGARAACRSAARAPSTPCSSPASSPSPRTRARRSRCATAPTGSARSCSSTASSCSPRDEAAAELGLDPARPTILVTPRPGRRGARGHPARARASDRPAARSRSRRSRSALAAADDVPEGVVGLRATYPMSRYFAAFDGAVAAAGYNAYHELIALGVPSLFVPMPRDTDDQPARARYAERAGIGLGVDGPGRPGARGEARAPARPGRARRDPPPPRRPRPRPRAPPQAAAWLADLAADAAAEWSENVA